MAKDASAPSDIVFLHGIEWQFDADLAGYSRPLQRNIEQAAPSRRMNFHECRWSNVVERDERALIGGVGVIRDFLSPEQAALVQRLFTEIDRTLQLGVRSWDAVFSTRLKDVQASTSALTDDVLSALLDVVFYLNPAYGRQVRLKVRETLSKIVGEPLLMGHGLGSLIALDIIRENLAATGRPGISRFVSVGSPLGLFQPGRDDPRFQAFEWINLFAANDFVGAWNPLQAHGYATAQDRKIEVSAIPVYSHLAYWDHEAVVQACL